MLISRSLVACVLPQPLLIEGPSSLQVQENVFFFCYPYNVKGNKVFDLESYTVFVFRNVIFHETIFPFVSTSCGSVPQSALSLPCVSVVDPLFDNIL